MKQKIKGRELVATMLTEIKKIGIIENLAFVPLSDEGVSGDDGGINDDDDGNGESEDDDPEGLPDDAEGEGADAGDDGAGDLDV